MHELCIQNNVPQVTGQTTNFSYIRCVYIMLAVGAVVTRCHIFSLTLFFFLQCAPEFKVPGLYVIDSIVRQSRHQFGHDKDVFGPRFSKNFEKTFRNLFVCPPDDQVWVTL